MTSSLSASPIGRMATLSYYFIVLVALPACSIMETRVYSRPEQHGEKYKRPGFDWHARLNPRMTAFDNAQMPSAFIDSMDHSIVQLRLGNEYSSILFGPPVIPLIPFRQGYGHPTNKKDISADERDDSLTVELTIYQNGGDEISFIPANFLIRLRNKGNAESHVVGVEGVADIHQRITCSEKKTWKIYFSPGVHVKDLPLFLLNSLSINNKPFHPEGVGFRIGKKTFYSALVSING